MRLLRGNLAGRLDAIHFRHQQIHQDDIRLELFGQADGFQAVLCLSDDFDVIRLRQECFDASPDDGMIVYDQNPDDMFGGLHSFTFSTIFVPWPGADSTVKLAPIFLARSRIFRKPCPPSCSTASGSKPTPSSVMVSRTRPASSISRTVTWLAWAC